MSHHKPKSIKKVVKDPNRALAIGETVDGRWEIMRVIGEGGFGAIYEVRDLKPSEGSSTGSQSQPEKTYAMKVIFIFSYTISIFINNFRFFFQVESVKAPVHEQVLRMDVNVLKRMRDKKSRHFVTLLSIGSTDRVNYMITSLVGSNLHELKRKQRGKFKFRTVAHLASNILEALKEMHEIG